MASGGAEGRCAGRDRAGVTWASYTHSLLRPGGGAVDRRPCRKHVREPPRACTRAGSNWHPTRTRLHSHSRRLTPRSGLHHVHHPLGVHACVRRLGVRVLALVGLGVRGLGGLAARGEGPGACGLGAWRSWFRGLALLGDGLGAIASPCASGLFVERAAHVLYRRFGGTTPPPPTYASYTCPHPLRRLSPHLELKPTPTHPRRLPLPQVRGRAPSLCCRFR
eukprot:scaffold11413_cov79-Isochrysis_galbana.AAC.1